LYAGRLSIKVHPVSSLPNIPCDKDEHLSEQRFVPSRFCFQQHVLNLKIAIPGDPNFGPTAGTETTHEEKVIPSFSRACVTGQAREVSPDVVVSSSEHLSGIYSVYEHQPREHLVLHHTFAFPDGNHMMGC
jgi:hypothetical protein